MNYDTKITISYYAEGARNDLGEPARTLTTRALNVSCRLVSRSPTVQYEFPVVNRLRNDQGTSYIPTMLLVVKRSQALSDGDIITDAHDNTYIVARVVPIGRSHKEAVLATHP